MEEGLNNIMNKTTEVVCASAFKCFLSIFVGVYFIWYFIGGYEKWDKYFEGKKLLEKKLPVLIEGPLKNK